MPWAARRASRTSDRRLRGVGCVKKERAALRLRTVSIDK